MRPWEEGGLEGVPGAKLCLGPGMRRTERLGVRLSHMEGASQELGGHGDGSQLLLGLGRTGDRVGTAGTESFQGVLLKRGSKGLGVASSQAFSA